MKVIVALISLVFSTLAFAINVSPVDSSNINRTGDLTATYNVGCSTYCNGATYYLSLKNLSSGSSTIVDTYYASPGTPYGTTVSATVNNLATGSYQFSLSYQFTSPWGTNTNNGGTSSVITVIND